MKSCLFLLPLFVLLTACRQSGSTQSPGAEQPETAFQEMIDTAYGFDGCDRATMVRVSPTEFKLSYQHFFVEITTSEDAAGEKVTVTRRDTTAQPFFLPTDDNGFFAGINRNKAFVDYGTGPDGREVAIIDLDKKQVQYRTAYVDTILISNSGKMWFYMPVEASAIDSLPDCPQAKAWEAAGLGTGWGQRCLFDFGNRSLTKKSEYKCVALQ